MAKSAIPTTREIARREAEKRFGSRWPEVERVMTAFPAALEDFGGKARSIAHVVASLEELGRELSDQQAVIKTFPILSEWFSGPPEVLAVPGALARLVEAHELALATVERARHALPSAKEAHTYVQDVTAYPGKLGRALEIALHVSGTEKRSVRDWAFAAVALGLVAPVRPRRTDRPVDLADRWEDAVSSVRSALRRLKQRPASRRP